MLKHQYKSESDAKRGLVAEEKNAEDLDKVTKAQANMGREKASGQNAELASLMTNPTPKRYAVWTW